MAKLFRNPVKQYLDIIEHAKLFIEYKNIDEAAYKEKLNKKRVNPSKKKQIDHFDSKYYWPTSFVH